MPRPNANESEEEFVGRCIPIVIEDGTAEDAKQATAICHSMWRQAQAEKEDMWLTRDQVAELCPDCADTMDSMGLEKINLAEQKQEGLDKLCDRFDFGDPGWFTECVDVTSSYSWVDDPESLCARLHKHCLGFWPGEHRSAEEEKALSERGIIPELKFSGSPRNRYGTHSSYGFKGDYAAAWHCHFAGVRDRGAIQGTVRRTEMIGAAMKPQCDLPSTENIDAASAPKEACSFPEKPSDYGLDRWDDAETDEQREGIKLSCSDLAVIKRAALGEIKRRADEREEEGKGLKGLAARFLVFKQGDGVYRWVLFSSNAFEDREGEIVSQKALEADVARMDVAGEYGPLRWWHYGEIDVEKLKAGKGLDLGRCDFNAMHGRILVESGVFDSPIVGKAMREHAADLAASIGFFHPLDEPDEEGTYKTILRFERSLLPSEAAANGLTELAAVKEVQVEDKKIEKLRGLLGDEGKDLVDALLEQAGSTEQKALDAGVRFKGEGPGTDGDQPQPVPVPGIVEKILAMFGGTKREAAAAIDAGKLLDDLRRSRLEIVLSDKSIDLSKRMDAVWSAVNAMSPKVEGHYMYARTVYDDFAIIEQDGKCFQAPYAVDAEGAVTFSAPSAWTEVELSWKPIGQTPPAGGTAPTAQEAHAVAPTAKAGEEMPPKDPAPKVADMTMEQLTKLIREIVTALLAEQSAESQEKQRKLEAWFVGDLADAPATLADLGAQIAALKSSDESLAKIVAELVAEQPRAMAAALRASISPETDLKTLPAEVQERLRAAAPGPDAHFTDKFVKAIKGNAGGQELTLGGGPAGT